MNGMRYKLVTFDAMKTLVKMNAPPGQKYAEIAKMYGINCSKEALTQAYKPNFEKQMKQHPNYGQRTGLGWENWWRQVVYNTFRDAKCDAEKEKLDIVITQLLDIYKTHLCWQPREGAFGLLSFLNFRKVLIGAVSNFDPRLHDILSSVRMRPYFRFVLTSYELGAEKPDVKVFKEAMGRSGLINLRPEECLHVGDHVMADYYAAMNNRWKGVLVRQDKPKFREEHPAVNPRDVFPSLYELLKHMVVINKAQPVFKGPRTTGSAESAV